MINLAQEFPFLTNQLLNMYVMHVRLLFEHVGQRLKIAGMKVQKTGWVGTIASQSGDTDTTSIFCYILLLERF